MLRNAAEKAADVAGRVAVGAVVVAADTVVVREGRIMEKPADEEHAREMLRALGGHVQRCVDCGHDRIAYNSCRNRHCPKCQSLERVRWVEARSADLLPTHYFHVVFTLPEEIAHLALQNKRVVYGILFAANDPVAIGPVLTKALEAGIHVVGYDANSVPEAREWFVNQASFNGIAKAMMDSLAAEKGEDASFGIVTSTFTTPNQARWISEMWAYTNQCFPEMTWLETLEAQEDNNLSFEATKTLIAKYGDELDGVFGMTSVATPAGADAVTQEGVCDQVSVIGLALPSAMKPFVESGCVKHVVLWNAVDLGYAAVYAMRAVVDGTLKPGDTELEAGRLGTLQIINGSEILLGPPTIFTPENINDFDF